MRNETGTTQVKDRKTGEIITAVYYPNRLGNMQFNVDGKFYPDRKFDKKFEIFTDGKGKES